MQLTVKTLRHYKQKELLIPDEESHTPSVEELTEKIDGTERQLQLLMTRRNQLLEWIDSQKKIKNMEKFTIESLPEAVAASHREVISDYSALEKLCYTITYITMKRIIFILSMMFFSVLSYAQTDMRFEAGKGICIVRENKDYTVHNDSDEPYFTFLWTGSRTDNRERDILRYFYTLHGDFCLFNLLTENMVFPEGFTPVVGKLFLKEMPPHSKFTYSFPTVSIERNYEQYIYVEKVSYISSLIGPLTKASQIYYNGDSVIVDSSTF